MTKRLSHVQISMASQNLILLVDLKNKMNQRDKIIIKIVFIQFMKSPSAYSVFLQKLPPYTKYNYFLTALSSIQLLLMISVIPSHMLCHQGLPIAIYNIIAQSMTIFAPLACNYSAKQLKYFNTVLAFLILLYFVKIVQIMALTVFGQAGTCRLQLVFRLPVVIFLILELVCLAISGWILKRVRRVDREHKAVGILTNKQFLSD